MRHEEEVEATLNNFGLLNEAVINVGTLRRVEDVSGVRAWVFSSLLEESLSHTLIDDDECDVGKSNSLR